MRNLSLWLLTIILSILIVLSCETIEDQPPDCFILYPKTNSKVVSGNRIKISAIAKSEQSTIIHLIVYIDNEKLITLDAIPYNFYWDTDDYPLGLHTLKIEAMDKLEISETCEIAIEIIPHNAPQAVIDKRDGQTYQVVEIGEQVWMSENLKFKNEFSVYVNNQSANTFIYGYLYMTRIGTGPCSCPDEWHIPTRDDWNQLIQFLGGDRVAGGKLKETDCERWKSPNTGATNLSGFSTRPAGSLRWDSLSERFRESARFFTSFYSNYIFIDFNSQAIKREIHHPSNEFYSIRCIRDY